MTKSPTRNARRRLSRLLATTCLTAMPGLILGANAQTVDETGTALGNGPDTGAVAGGSVNVSGAADVRGVGVSTDGGDDSIENTGSIDVDVLADQSLVFSGFGASQDGADVRAEGLGFFGFGGDDELINSGDINVQTTGDADVFNLGLSLFGFLNFNAPSNVDVTSAGIDGGRGRDVIDNRSTVFASSTSGVSMLGQNPSSFAKNASVDITADAYTAGIRGIRGRADTINSGSVDLAATSDASSVTIDLEIVNGAVVDSSTNANASAVGIEGGGASDLISNSGSINGGASASASRTSVALSLSDGGIGDSSLNATAHSIAMSGGGNDDRLYNTGSLSAAANADVVSTGVEINLLDIAGGSFDLSPEARATGIDGGSQDDLLDNSGSILSTATAGTVSTNVNLSLVDLTVIGGRIAAGFDGDVEADEEPPIQAIANGLSGGWGDDQLFNRAGGVITLSGAADAVSTGVSVAAIGAPDAAFQSIFQGETLASLDTYASSRILGMSGGIGDDGLFNFGTIMGTTTSSAVQTGVAVSVPAGFLPDAAGFLPGFTLGGAGAATWAGAVGLAGDGGDDVLENAGLIDLDAIADALAVGVSVELPDISSADGFAFDLSLTLADVVTESDASATGMAGGDDDDVLVNAETGEIVVDATAGAASTGVGVTAGIEGEGVVSEGVVVQASTDAEASAIAMNGGDGNDTIINDGAASGTATATATTVGVTVALEGVAEGVAAGIAAVDGAATATATSRSIAGGSGSDVLINNGSLGSDATATAGATGVSVALTGAQIGGFAAGGALSITGATAMADAAGIDWSGSEPGAENNGSIEANATANAFGDSVSVAVSGAMAGLTLNAGLADSSTTAIATATGVDAPFGSQAFANFETLNAVSSATADSDSVGAELGVVVEGGVAAGASLTRTVTDATATSSGVLSNFGWDSVTNLGTINAAATADADSTSLAIALNGTMAGVALNVAAADGKTTATAQAAGIDTGWFGDSVTTLGTLTSNANAMATADSISVDFAATIEAGLVAGVALARADVTADAHAVGVDTGSGADELIAGGSVDVGATSTADADSISIAAQGSAAGVAGGGAVVDAATTASADASGLNSGGGGDAVSNTSVLTVMSDADSRATGVGVEIGVAGVGVAAGLGLADVSTEAKATSAGIEGGLGVDEIVNAGVLDVDGNADASGAAVAIVLAGAVEGGSLAVSLADATVDATATATGIAGDDALRAGDDESDSAPPWGESADFIVNAGVIHTDTIATSVGTAVSVAAPVSFVPLGFALATAETNATGSAYGIDAGYGDDAALNMANLFVTSDVNVTGASVAASVSALALGAFSGGANSAAYGISGGAGDDELFNNAEVMSTALADALGVTVALNLVGGSVGDLGTMADGDAFGIYGGAGEDVLENEGITTANADVRAVSTNVSLAVNGVTVNDVSTKAFADAVGMGGGADHDRVINSGEVNAISLAETPGVSVSLVGTGAVFNDATTRSEATSHGLSGGAGGDEILNTDVVTSTATATATGVGVSVGLVAGGTADVSTTADAIAHSVDGGEGDDTVVNRAALSSAATSRTTSTSVNVNVAGAAFADADTNSTSYAAGIAGGGGNDEILNEGGIVATSSASNSANAVAVSLGGVGDGDVNTTAVASAAGIDGGDGDDLIGHAGSISATSSAEANARSVTVGLVGAGLGDVRLVAQTDNVGIDGGAGDDDITTFESSTIVARGSVNGGAANTSVQLVGGTSNRNVFGFTPSSTGVSGGDGDDLIRLAGTADVDATSTFALRNTSISLIGVAFAGAGVTSSPTATGVFGGAGDDRIFVENLVDASANNVFTMNGLTVNLAGYSSSRPTIGGVSSAVGVDAGADDDFVLTEGEVKSQASSSNRLGGTQLTFLGANHARADVGAVSTASGILGGAGEDGLLLRGLTDVDATATAHLDSLAYTFAGAGAADDEIIARAVGVGLDAGADDDLVANEGDMYVDTLATLYTTGDIAVSFGGAVSGAVTEANASSSGLLGGEGDDYLLNSGLVRVGSTASGSISRTNYAFVGGAASASAANANAVSLGMGGGAGDDELENAGRLSVRSSSSTTASGNTTATFAIGGAKASSKVSSTASSVGMAGDNGDDYLKNFGEILAAASASPNSVNQANVGGFFSNGVTDSRTSASTRAIGIDGGAGENAIWNTGVVAAETLGSSRTESRSDGDTLANVFGISLDAVARATSSNNGQDARGANAGKEATGLYNTGTIDVLIQGGGYAYANADGDAIVAGDGTATAIVGVSDANAYGFIAGNGGNTLFNSGDVIVAARPTGNADAISDADGVDAFMQPDSRATASVSLNRVHATGVWFGEGNDRVVNRGLIDVSSAPRAAQAEADAGYGGDVLGIDAFATATASVNGASAHGLRLGGGENTLVNSGEIIARAIPHAAADADARGVGFDGDADASATARALNAYAYGVETGGGDDVIWNSGAITAISNPTVSAAVTRVTGRACAIDVGDVEVCESGETGGSGAHGYVDGRRAIGVVTNGGDDVLVNAGSITASIGASAGNGGAISMGSGNDTLVLLDGSSLFGNVSLGDGDDTMRLSGVSTANAGVYGDAGVDTLVFDGEGSFSGGFVNFESASKIGDGLFSVAWLRSLAKLEIGGGTLQSNADYVFNADGVFRTFVDASGAHGGFATDRTATLGGAIEIAANFGLYADGQTYNVITASRFSGAFNSESLPEAKPLLSFDLVQNASAFQVVANAASFATVAGSNARDQAFALQLDEAAPLAHGKLAEQLATIQHLPDGSNFEAAISWLNPARYGDFARHTHWTAGKFEFGTRHRLRNLRRTGQLRVSGRSVAAAFGTLSTAGFSQVETSDGGAFGAWKADLGAQSDRFGEGYGSIHGFDYLTPNGTIMGGSIVATRSDPLSAQLIGLGGRANNIMMSVYGSQRINDNGYLDAIFSYGEQDYSTSTPVLGGSRSFAQQAEHGGRNLSVSVETGQGFDFAGGRSEVFGGLRYGSISEDRFDAASFLDTVFDVRRSDRHDLEGEIGVRVGWDLNTPVGAFTPRMSLSWSRNMSLTGDRMLATFDDAPDFEFRLPGELRNQDELRFGAELDLWVSEHMSVTSRFQTNILEPDASVDSLMEFKLIW